ncbi:MAG: DUF2281 domain-containing protein [Candidatus Hatepunaea meridiana]|nr:DUF2281 domain-containing protein [Candidatus Hatepunaea meridiana]
MVETEEKERVLTLEEKIRALSPELQQRLESIIDSLLSENDNKPEGQFKLDWKGDLRHLRDKFTSVELQHLALEWRNEDVSTRHNNNS